MRLRFNIKIDVGINIKIGVICSSIIPKNKSLLLILLSCEILNMGIPTNPGTYFPKFE